MKLGNHILHGGDYNPDQWLDCPEILDEDVRLMKKAGVNCVSLGIFAWSRIEPEEGRYELDWLAEIIQRLYENGIDTILATPTGAMPHWLADQYEEVRQVGEDGVRNDAGKRHNYNIVKLLFFIYDSSYHLINILPAACSFSIHSGLFFSLFHQNRSYNRETYDAQENKHQHTGNRPVKEDIEAASRNNKCLTHIILQNRGKHEGQKHRSRGKIIFAQQISRHAGNKHDNYPIHRVTRAVRSHHANYRDNRYHIFNRHGQNLNQKRDHTYCHD